MSQQLPMLLWRMNEWFWTLELQVASHPAPLCASCDYNILNIVKLWSPYGANIHIATSTIPILNSLNHRLTIFPQHGKVINVTSLNVYGQGTISRTAAADGAISNRLCSDITPCVHRPLRKAVEEPPSTRPNL